MTTTTTMKATTAMAATTMDGTKITAETTATRIEDAMTDNATPATTSPRTKSTEDAINAWLEKNTRTP